MKTIITWAWAETMLVKLWTNEITTQVTEIVKIG